MSSSAEVRLRPNAGDETPLVPAASLGQIRCGGDLTVALQDMNGVLVVALRGEVGYASRLGFHSALNAVFTSEPARILIDASSITECDRRGLGALIDAADRATDSGIPLVVSGLTPRHRTMLQKVWRPAVTDALTYPTLELALAAVTGQPAADDATHGASLNRVLLHRSLSASRVIEQAKGALMAIYGLSAEAAEEALRRHSLAHRMLLRVLAERLIMVVQHGPVGTVPIAELDTLLDDVAHAS